MHDLLYELTPYAPLVILIGAFLDIFFLSGYILYGGATLGAVGMMLMTDMITVPQVILAALTGTLLGNQTNYWIGRYFNTTNFVKKRLGTRRAQKAEGFLRSRGLFLFMLVACFITFFRPIHGVILGAFNIRWSRFILYDIIISFFWVTFWLFVILYGEKLWLKFFG